MGDGVEGESVDQARVIIDDFDANGLPDVYYIASTMLYCTTYSKHIETYFRC